MRIVFVDERLGRICTDEAHRLGLPISVISAARRRLIQLDAARDERDLRNLKGMHYKKLSGTREGQRSVRINDQYRIVFTVDEAERPPVIRILEIGDIH